MSNETPVKENLITEQPDGKGRPAFADDQYWSWLEVMRPFLELGNSIYYSANKAGIVTHYDVIMIKYRAGGPFTRKIDAYRAMPGELTNETVIKQLKNIADKVAQDRSLTKEDLRILELMAKHHRTAQPFFVNRHETAEADPEKIGKVLDVLEEKTDYERFGSEASRQILEINPSLQDQKQAGSNSDVSAEHNPAEAHSGEGSAPVQ